MQTGKKYVVVLGDGMADRKIGELGEKTPLQSAKTDAFDFLARRSTIGLVSTVPKDMPPGSDIANLSILGYDPSAYHTGRSPLEAANLSIDMADGETAFRCNLVTLSEEPDYADKVMIDYSAGEISSEEGRILIEEIGRRLSNEKITFFPGVSYRNIMILKDLYKGETLTAPHDISKKSIKDYVPADEAIYLLMEKSYDILKDHPINKERIRLGKNPANAIWIWGEGKKPALPNFYDKYKKSGAMISAVDLLNGIARLAGMKVIDVPGATGRLDTNFKGKADAAISALLSGSDFVYVHIEAADESSHHGSLSDKIESIEKIDMVTGEIFAALKKSGCDFSILVAPDHATPLSTMTHSREPVPFMIYDSTNETYDEKAVFDEDFAAKTGIIVKEGHNLLDYFFQNKKF